MAFRIHIILLSQSVGYVLSLNSRPKSFKVLYQNWVFVLTLWNWFMYPITETSVLKINGDIKNGHVEEGADIT